MNMRIIKSLMLTAAGAICILSSCKEKSSRSAQLSYYETQCANPWEYGNSQSEHINNIQQYLAANGVNTNDIVIVSVPDSAVTCLACTCPAGRRVDIIVEDEDVTEANSLGFF